MENKQHDSEQWTEKQTVEEKTPEKKEFRIQQPGGIRCYSQTGFFAPETQPDGTVIKRFYYGREGD